MRRLRWASTALAGVTVAALGIGLPATTASAAPVTLKIQVGGDSAVNGVAFEGMRFLAPPNLTVHNGDTITFTMAGFHTATLLPDNTDAVDFRMDQMGPGGKYSLVTPDTDDTGMFLFNTNDVLPTDPTCGTPSNPCPYDGSAVVGSGAPLGGPGSFSVTINDKNVHPNSPANVWVICMVHADMQMRIHVVDASSTGATTTQSQIDAYAKSQVAADHEAAAAALPKLQQQTKHTTASGHKVWDAYAGYDGNGWGLDGMFPSKLHIKKGQRVSWHFTQLMGNPHTVTFPKSAAVAGFKAFPTPACEGANGAADTPPTSPPPAFCANPQDLELHVAASTVLRVGSHKYGGHGYRNSGIEGAGVPSMAPYNLKFTHKSSKKGFKYACIIHGGMMSGRVVVR